MAVLQKQASWHSIRERELCDRFGVNQETGLSEEEAKKRLEQFGPNRIEGREQFRLFSIIFHQIKNPLVIILLVAGGISFLLGEYADTVVIALTVFVNTVVGALQEGKASKAFLKLQEHIEKRAVVVRGGHEREIDAADVVLGDIITLRAGGGVPADARIVDARGLRANESTLTGEWIAVDKDEGELDPEVRLVDRTNMVWAGTLVEDGWARAVVVNTREYTEFGKITTLVEETQKVRTPLQRNMQSIANIISVSVLSIVAVIFLLGLLRGVSAGEMFVTVVAIAVAAVPEGLPVAITVILALGMERILRKGGLVKQLTAAETLGSTNVILTDKTGTLTQAKMQISEVITGEEDDGASNILALKIGMLTSDAFIENPEAEFGEWKIRGTPTDRALLLAGVQAGLQLSLMLQESPRIDFLPFEAERRFAASLHTSKTGSVLYVAGAPEVVVFGSTHVYTKGRAVKLNVNTAAALQKKYEDATAHGARVIAVGFRENNVKKIPIHPEKEEDGIFHEFVFVGFIGFHDPLRPDVKAAILRAKGAGLRPIMVTGDHRLTAMRIAEEIGIDGKKEGGIVEGSDIESIDPRDFEKQVENVDVYARVLPHQKLHIVEAWQRRGAIVAMTGDGVNDAPALKKADVGVALGSGTEVAKEAADIVLLDDSFSVLVAAIEQGRVILDNLRKIITFVFATGFTEIILVGGTLLAGFPLPVLATQILWTNLVGEGLLNFAFAFEPQEDDVMRQRIMPKNSIFTREMWFLIGIIGIATDLILLSLFFVLYYLQYPIDLIRTIMFTGLALDSIFFAYSLRSLRKPLWRIQLFSNPFFFVTIITSVMLLGAALTVAPLQRLLHLSVLGAPEVGLILILGIINIIAIEGGKWIFIARKNV